MPIKLSRVSIAPAAVRGLCYVGQAFVQSLAASLSQDHRITVVGGLMAAGNVLNALRAFLDQSAGKGSLTDPVKENQP